MEEIRMSDELKDDQGAQGATADASAGSIDREQRPHAAPTFTPGPWKLVGREVLGRAFNGAWCLICKVSGGTPQHADNNARLIAAAPDLYEALKAITAHMDRAGGDADGMPECPWCKAGPDGDDHRGDCELLTARAAIAKAEGRS